MSNVIKSWRLKSDLFANLFLLTSSLFLYIKFLNYLLLKEYKKSLIVFPIFLLVALSLFIDEMTVSRLINLTFFISVISISIYMLPKIQKLIIFSIISLLFITYIFNSSSYQKGINEVQETYTENKYEGSWGHRIKLVIYGIDMWLENPYIGRGTDDIVTQMRKIRQENPEDFQDATIHFHNQHVLILVQTGIVGYFFFLMFIYNLYKLKIKNNEINMYKNGIIIVFLLIMCGEHYLQMIHTSTFFALFIGLFIVYKNLEINSNKVI